VLPANECLRTDAARVGERNDRLKEESQLAAFDGAVQLVLGGVASEGTRAHGVVEHFDTPAPELLGVIHRRVGVAK
jgi:hypothetical protein